MTAPLPAGTLRVLLATDVPRTPDTGMGRHQWFLTRELRRLGFAVEEFNSEDVPNGLPDFLRRFQFPWAVLQRVRQRESSAEPYDAVVVHEGSAGQVCLARRFGWVRTPCIVMSHNPEQKVWELNLELARRGLHRVPLKSRVSWPMTRLWQSNAALRWADFVVCLSQEDEEFVGRRYGRSRDCIGKLQNGVDPAFFGAPQMDGAPRILFVGPWLAHKGVADLRSALLEAMQQHNGARASLLGVGTSEDAVRAQFPGHLRSRLEIRRRVDPQELPGLLAAHNIFLLPSWFEGMPLSLLEAMATGLAVVVTDVGGMKDLIRHEETGLRVPPQDAPALAAALGLLCRDSALRSRLGGAARQHVRAYTWAAAAQTLAGFIHTAISSTAHRCASTAVSPVERYEP